MARIPRNFTHDPSDDDNAMPPSFSPNHEHTSDPVPEPVSESTSEHASEHAPGNKAQSADTPPSFAPQSRKRTSRSSSSAAFSAGRSSAGISDAGSSSAPQSFKPSLFHTRIMPHIDGTQNMPAVSPQTAGPAARQIKKKPRHIAAKIIVILLALMLALGIWGWFWVDGQLNRTFNLSNSTDNSSANTWLVLGSDARDGKIEANQANRITGFRTDTILVLTKPKSGPASLISIPRDSYVIVDGEGMKINAVAELAGYDKLVHVVESITSMKIDHIVQVGFDGVADIVDAMGGVDLCYDQTVNDVKSGLKWKAGCHTVGGKTALAFSRMRYSDPEGDIGRAKRQRKVISAIMKKATSPAILANPAKAMNVVSETFASLKEDKKASTASMISMALAFRDTSGQNGVTGSVYYTDLNYQPGYVGSAIRLDTKRNTKLFKSLQNGSISPGIKVGGLSS